MNYYRKPINKVVDDVKLKMQLGALTLKISENNDKIDDLLEVDKNIKNDVSNNTTKIDTNESTINDVISAQGVINGFVSTNLSTITENSSKIDKNENNISTNLGKITANEVAISSNLGKIDNIKEFLIYSEDFKKTFNIEKQIFRFNKTTHFYTIFGKEITYDFTKNSLLFIDNNIHYKYENLLNDYHRLQHEYNIYDDEDN